MDDLTDKETIGGYSGGTRTAFVVIYYLLILVVINNI